MKGEATVADIFGTMEQRVRPEGVEGVTANYGYNITGEGGGEWTVCVTDGVVKVVEGLQDPGVTTTVAAEDFIAINLGTLSGMSWDPSRAGWMTLSATLRPSLVSRAR